MIKKLFSTKKAKIYTIIIAAGVLICCLLILFTATASDASRLIYEENNDGTYTIKDIKNIYRGGIFLKETLVIPAEHKGEKIVSIEKVDSKLIKEIIIEDGIEKIESGAFTGMEKLEKVIIPQSVKQISDSAFSNCVNLKEVVLSDQSTLETIGAKAFLNCGSLVSIDLPDTLKSIGKEAFKGAKLLKTINCDIVNIDIDYNAFEETVFANDIMKANNGFFIIDGVLYDFDYQYYNYKNEDNIIENLIIPSNVKVINNGAFYQLDDLKSVTISESVEIIGESAFEGCSSLNKIFFSEKAITIETKAFYNCNDLFVKVYLNEEIEENFNVGRNNNSFDKAKSVYAEGDTYYTYVYLTKEDSDNKIESKLLYDLNNFLVYRINEGVKEIFDEMTYEFTAENN